MAQPSLRAIRPVAGRDCALASEVAKHHRGHSAELLEAFRQKPQRGLPGLVGGEADEPLPAPGQHRAVDLQFPSSPQSMTRCSPGLGDQGR